MVLSIEPLSQTPPPQFWGDVLTPPPKVESPTAPGANLHLHLAITDTSASDACSNMWNTGDMHTDLDTATLLGPVDTEETSELVSSPTRACKESWATRAAGSLVSPKPKHVSCNSPSELCTTHRHRCTSPGPGHSPAWASRYSQDLLGHSSHSKHTAPWHWQASHALQPRARRREGVLPPPLR